MTGSSIRKLHRPDIKFYKRENKASFSQNVYDMSSKINLKGSFQEREIEEGKKKGRKERGKEGRKEGRKRGRKERERKEGKEGQPKTFLSVF